MQNLFPSFLRFTKTKNNKILQTGRKSRINRFNSYGNAVSCRSRSITATKQILNNAWELQLCSTLYLITLYHGMPRHLCLYLLSELVDHFHLAPALPSQLGSVAGRTQLLHHAVKHRNVLLHHAVEHISHRTRFEQRGPEGISSSVSSHDLTAVFSRSDRGVSTLKSCFCLRSLHHILVHWS